MRAECGRHWVSRVKVFAGQAAAGFAVAEQIVSSSPTNVGTPLDRRLLT
jgi:hypothetical protein